MAVLADADRVAVWAQHMQYASRNAESLALLKSELRAAVNAIDDFLSTNAGAINAAIPQPARGALTVPQKARLLMFVIQKRYLQGV